MGMPGTALIKGIHHPELGWPTGHLYFHATTEEWWYAEGLLSAVERLRFGVTTGLTVVGATPARMDSPFILKNRPSNQVVGIRTVLAVGPPDPYVSHVPRTLECNALARRHAGYKAIHLPGYIGEHQKGD